MLTLGTQRDLTNDVLIKGIIDSVVTVNQFYQMLPFKGIQGNALAYNREGIFMDIGTLTEPKTRTVSITIQSGHCKVRTGSFKQNKRNNKKK